MSPRAKSWDVAGTGSMVVDEIHLAKRILGADEKSLLRSDERGNVVRRLVGGVVLNHLGWAQLLEQAALDERGRRHRRRSRDVRRSGG